MPSQPSNKEEEEVFDISEYEDNFKVFSCLQSFVVLAEDFSYSPSAQVSQIQEGIGIQRKPRASLMEVMESQVRGKAPEVAAQTKLPPLPTPYDS